MALITPAMSEGVDVSVGRFILSAANKNARDNFFGFGSFGYIERE
jgi:hypothetical protein